MIPLLMLAGCEEPIEPVDESARGEFIMGGVITTDIVDPYSYASRCPQDNQIAITLRTAANEQMINPGDWLVANEGWLEIDSFGQPGGRVVGLVDIWGDLTSPDGELLWEEYHIRGSFDVPRTDTCQ